MIVAARYSCSSKMTRANSCGNVSGDRDSVSSQAARTSSALYLTTSFTSTNVTAV
jgi:hypothetical protein